MISIPQFSLLAAMHMRRKYPGWTERDLHLLWHSTFHWIGKYVMAAHLEPEPPPLILAAAYMYMQHVCEKMPQKKTAYLHDAMELLAPYM